MRLPDHIMKDGRRRLARLLPYALSLAQKQALKEARGLSPRTLLGQSITGRLRLDRLDALTIHRDFSGAWHAGLHLTGLPRGFPSVISTPQDTGLLTERSAEKAALRLLTQALVEVRHNELARSDTSPRDDRIFALGDLEFCLPGDLIDRLSTTGSDDNRTALGHQCLAKAIDEMGANSITQHTWDQASSSARVLAYRGMALLLTVGQARYSPSCSRAPGPIR